MQYLEFWKKSVQSTAGNSVPFEKQLLASFWQLPIVDDDVKN